MNWYLFIFIWLIAMFLFENQKNVMTPTNVLGKEEYRVSILFAAAAFFPIFWLASQGTPQSDTWLYLSIFDGLPNTVSGLIQTLSDEDSGKGFAAFECIIKIIFGNNRTAFRTILGLLHSIPFILVCRKYSEDYLFTVFLFAASGCHTGWMMNGLRQYASVMIIFAATPFVLKKKYVPAVLLVLLAATFHTSALIMLPVVFIVQGEAWNRKTLILIVIAIIAMYAFSTTPGLFDSMLEGTEYAGTEAAMAEAGDDGTNPIRVLVNAIPTLLAFMGQRQIKEEKDPVINLCVNMSVITLGVYLISIVTSGIMVGRLPIYMSLYNLILLPYEISHLFTEKSVKIMRILTIGFYMLYYNIQVGF